MLLCDWQIQELVEKYNMIDPFLDHQVRDGKISAGLSSVGYDMRLAPGIRFPVIGVLDPKDTTRSGWTSSNATNVAPRSFVLARSIERFKLPRNVCMTVVGKSTYARVGLIVNVTPGEPGWEGYLTLELSNTSPLPIVIYPGEGIAQCQFHRIDNPEISYKDRSGKYDNQPPEPVLPKL